MLLAVALIVLAAAWRVAGAHTPALANFAPLMALGFCGAVYLQDRRLWAVPFVALLASDLYLDSYYSATFGESWTWPSAVLRLVCFAAALPLGRAVAARKSWLTLGAGALTASFIFYGLTNTDAWLRDPYYPASVTGWVQALTVGRPEFPPTWMFFRNTLASDLLFTGLFAFTLELAARWAGRPSLLSARA